MAHTRQKKIIYKGKDPLIQQWHLLLTTELTQTSNVLQWLENTIQSLITAKVYWQCQVIVVEAFTNIVRHAHKDLPTITPIEIKINLYDHYIEIMTLDWGKPFDLNKYLENEKKTKQSLEKEEGRGLYFIYKLSDELDYKRLDSQQNCLIVRKLICDN